MRDHFAGVKWPSSECPHTIHAASDAHGIQTATARKEDNREPSVEGENRATIDFRVPP